MGQTVNAESQEADAHSMYTGTISTSIVHVYPLNSGDYLKSQYFMLDFGFEITIQDLAVLEFYDEAAVMNLVSLYDQEYNDEEQTHFLATTWSN